MPGPTLDIDLLNRLSEAFKTRNHQAIEEMIAADAAAAHAAIVQIRMAAWSRISAAEHASRQVNRADRAELGRVMNDLRRAKTYLMAVRTFEQRAMSARGEQRRAEKEESVRRRVGMTYNQNSRLIRAIRYHKAVTLASDIEPEAHDLELWAAADAIAAETHAYRTADILNSQPERELHSHDR